MCRCASFRAHFETLEAVQSAQRPFHHPPVPSETLAALKTAPGNPRNDPASIQGLTAATEIVTLVRVKLIQMLAGHAPATTPHARHRIHRCFKHPAVVHIRRRNHGGEWKAVAVNQDVPFAPPLASVGGVRTGQLSTARGGDGRGVKRGAGPVDRSGGMALVEEDAVWGRPHLTLLPFDKPPPATAVSELLGEGAPGDACMEHEEETFEREAIVNARTSACDPLV